MSDSTQEQVDLSEGPLRPMPEHVFDMLVETLRQSLGERWGAPRASRPSVGNLLSTTLKGIDGVYLAADVDYHAQQGARMQLWVDHADLDLVDADDIVHEVLQGFGDREILVVCRLFEEDGIHYRFASGTVEAALTGTVVLVGPYARDLAHLARIGSGQPMGFSA